MNTKICSKCKIEKSLSEFYEMKRGKYGVSSWCKICFKQYRKQYYMNNTELLKEQQKQYNKNNAQQIAKRMKCWYKNNKVSVAKYMKRYNKQYYKRDTLFETHVKQLEIFEEIRRCPENPKLLEVKCVYCGKWFIPTITQTKHRLQTFNGSMRGESCFYCSEACKTSCPTYGQKLYLKGQKQEHGTSKEVDAWFRQLVLETDNWTCQKCEQSKDEYPELVLHVHHIQGAAQKPMLQNDIDNAITLCASCHKEIHKKAGCTYFDLRRPKCKT